MAEVTRRRAGEFLRTVFEILREYPDGMQVRDLLKEFEGRFALNEFEKSEYPNNPGVVRWQKQVRFHTISAVKAGWLVKDKGQWCLTEEGKQAFHDIQDPEAFMREAVRRYFQWKQAQPEEIEEIVEEDDAALATNLEEAEEAAWTQIFEYLSNMPPYRFQDLIAGLLRGMGYHVAYVAPPGPDRGIDLVAYTDPLGASEPRIKVQVKRRRDKISVEGIRAFLAVLGDQDVGIFISIGGFTSDAEAEARHQERRRLTLIDAAQLVQLWTEYYDDIAEEEKQVLPLRPVFFLATGG